MTKMATALKSAGYDVLNVGYPSRSSNIEDLAHTVISEALEQEKVTSASRVHFVTHSLGGILVRQYLQTNHIDRLGRVVMLGPPNQGSEVVDKLGDIALFEIINGPSGNQLGTGAESLPNTLGPANFDLGIIAGDRSINWINSLAMIDGIDDGKVSVERTKLEGMADHVTIHATHPYLMRNRQAIQFTIRFLQTGTFLRPE
jgi:triacylglycerol lipase